MPESVIRNQAKRNEMFLFIDLDRSCAGGAHIPTTRHGELLLNRRGQPCKADEIYELGLASKDARAHQPEWRTAPRAHHIFAAFKPRALFVSESRSCNETREASGFTKPFHAWTMWPALLNSILPSVPPISLLPATPSVIHSRYARTVAYRHAPTCITYNKMQTGT